MLFSLDSAVVRERGVSVLAQHFGKAKLEVSARPPFPRGLNKQRGASLLLCWHTRPAPAGGAPGEEFHPKDSERR